MYKGKKILSIIPARGGSKGIPRKNIKSLAGKPLIAWTIEEAKKSKYIDRLILSSEDEEIINIAKEWGCEVPFIRPKELAQDDTPGIDPIIHAINTLPEKYDYVCMLQPTSPLRKVIDIDGFIEKCLKLETPACVTIVESSKSPYWMFKCDKDFSLKSLFPELKIVPRRQDLPTIYALNGAGYIAKTEWLLTTRSFLTEQTIGYIMDKLSSFDIDDESDFMICDYLLKERAKNV